jgi:hypothetical protein
MPGAAELGPLGADVLTSQRFNVNIVTMSDPKRATVYFEPDIHKALRLKSAVSERSISEMVNDAVRIALAEDADDLAAFDDRAEEPTVDFEDFVKKLKRSGKL